MTIKFKVQKETAALGSAVKISYDGILRVELFYDFREAPLVLNAPANIGDNALLVLGKFRDELWVNGNLFDEEWCCGNLLPIEPAEGFAFDKVPAPDRSEHLLRGAGLSELRRYGVNVGDCMPFSDGGRFHIFWLYDRHHHHSKWGLGAHQWAHASSEDLVHWDEHEMAVGIDDPLEGSICTGSVIHADNKFRAWYTVRMSDGSPARVSQSVSDDGYHFEKTGEYFVLPERYDRPSARDPKAIFEGGKYHLLLTTTNRATGKGCLAHLVSDSPDMKNFEDLGPVLEWVDGSQPECPDWFGMGGYYYLVWSIGGRARYAYSKEPFGESGWTIPADNIIDCGSVPKSAMSKQGRIFVGFVSEGGYAGHFVMKRAVQKPSGEISVEEI